MRMTELDRTKNVALNSAFELGYATKYVKQILQAETIAQVDQAMVSGRQSDVFESEASVRQHLKMEGIKVPKIRCTVGQNFID